VVQRSPGVAWWAAPGVGELWQLGEDSTCCRRMGCSSPYGYLSTTVGRSCIPAHLRIALRISGGWPSHTPNHAQRQGVLPYWYNRHAKKKGVVLLRLTNCLGVIVLPILSCMLRSSIRHGDEMQLQHPQRATSLRPTHNRLPQLLVSSVACS